jgi:hypothetical protein
MSGPRQGCLATGGLPDGGAIEVFVKQQGGKQVVEFDDPRMSWCSAKIILGLP